MDNELWRNAYEVLTVGIGLFRKGIQLDRKIGLRKSPPCQSMARLLWARWAEV